MPLLRVALLRGDDPHHLELERRLALAFDLVLVVEEPARAQLRRLWQRQRWRDAWAWTLDALRRRVLGLDRYRQRAFPPRPRPRIRTLPVENVNAPPVVSALRAVAADVVVVVGTGILRGDVLAAAGPTVLNLHGGYLPDYRGNHAIFHALREGAWDRLGSTVHFVTPALDGGDIVARARVLPQRSDFPEAVYCRAAAAGIDALVAVLRAYGAGTPLPRMPQRSPGRTFRVRDRRWRDDLALWLRTLRGHAPLGGSPREGTPEPTPKDSR
jgi:methionyl-tRNA formyltransferase